MAQIRHKAHGHREKPAVLTPPAAEPPRPAAVPAADEPSSGRGARWALLVWGLAFLFLISLILWDLVAALLFR